MTHLGAALRALPVPDHAPGFEWALRQRLVAERRRRSGRLSWRWPAAAAVAAAAALAVLVGLPRDEAATAAEVKAAVQTALARASTLSGVIVTDGPGPGDELRWRFAMTDEGDFRLTGIGFPDDVAYDASTGVARSLNRSASLGGDTLFAAERTGIAPGPPDGGPPTWILPRELGGFVRALLAAEDPRLRETEYQGCPAWQLDVPVEPNAIVPEFSGDAIAVTIDRETGMPVRVVETKRGAFIRELRLEQLAVDAELAPETFALDFPAGMEILRSDEGFRRVPLAEVAAAASYDPLVPAWVPDGFQLAEVAVARRSSEPTGVEGSNPPSERVVSLSYRRGLDQILVTTRLANGEWSDPLATGEGFVDRPERIRLGAGALAGSEAELVIDPRGIPHLWTTGPDLVVTVAGDAGRAELVRIAESLR